MDKRVAITGVGIVSPGGIGKDSYWATLASGKSCTRKIRGFDCSKLPIKIGAEISDDFGSYLKAMPENEIFNSLNRVTLFALIAARLALEDAMINIQGGNRKRIGASVGTALGSVEEALSLFSFLRQGDATPRSLSSILSFPTGSILWYLSFLLDCERTCLFSMGSVSASHAIGYAFECILHGKADIMLAGGTEAPLESITITSLSAIGALSKKNDQPEKASRPFDRERDGFVLAEGAAFIVLEDLIHALKRGAHIYTEVVGFEMTSDAYHMTASSPDLEQAARAIRIALKQADISSEDISYISAHGTSTKLNDAQETLLLKKVFGKRAYQIPVSSIMSMVGHSLGAAGAMQAVTCALVLEHQILPPTINYEYPDPECDLDYVPNQARKAKVDAILQNTFSFGGSNAVIIYKKP